MPLPASAISVRRRFLAARDVRVLRFHTPGGVDHDQSTHGHGSGSEAKQRLSDAGFSLVISPELQSVPEMKERVDAVAQVVTELCGDSFKDAGYTLEFVADESVPNGNHGGAPAMATWDPRSGTLRIADGVYLAEGWTQPGIGQAVVGEDLRTVVAHEIGHAFEGHFFGAAQIARTLSPTKLYDSKPRDYWEKGVSRYAASNYHELIAESFAAYTHPNYGHGGRTLPPEIEKLFDFAGVERRKFARFSRTTVSRAASRCNFAAIKQREDALAKTAVPEAANAVARGVRRMLGDDEQLASLLDDDPQDIAALALNGADVGRIRSAFDGALETAFETGRVTGANEVTRAGGQTVKASRERFAALREKAAGYIAANGFRMAENVSEATRAIIQAELLTGVKVGKRPAVVREAIWDALVRKGLTSRDAALGVETDEAVVGALNALWVDEEEDAAHYLDTLVRTNSFEAMNEARFEEFTDPALGGFVQALEYSAILDDNTTEICTHLDGRIYAAQSDVWDTYRPPNHYNCRSLLIPVTAIDGWDGVESDAPSVEPQAGFFTRCSHAEHFHTPGGHDHDQQSHAGGDGGGGSDDSQFKGVGSVFNAPVSKSDASKEAKAWRKANEERYRNDPEFKAVVDSVTLFTQGDYQFVRAMSEYAATENAAALAPGGEGWQRRMGEPLSGYNVLADYKSYFEAQGDLSDGTGRMTGREAGAALNKAIDTAPETTSAIYRGLTSQEAYKAAVDLKPGDTFEIGGATSFTASVDIAGKFAAGTASGQGDRGSPSLTQTVIQIEPGTRALNVSALSPWRQQEMLTRGKFEAAEVRTEKYDVYKGGFVYTGERATVVLKRSGV